MGKVKLNEIKLKTPRPRPTLRKKVDPAGLKPDEIAYTVNREHVSDFNVKKSANAWWLDQGKVSRLIDAFENGCTIEEACIHAKITINQYWYFTEVHPEFSQIKDALILLPNIRVRTAIVSRLTDIETAKWWAERKMKHEFNTRYEVVMAASSSLELSPEEKAEIDELLEKNRRGKRQRIKA